MTTLDVASHRVSALGAWGDRLAALRADFRAWNDARVTRRMLSALSARELDDIGLTRADIDAAARRRA